MAFDFTNMMVYVYFSSSLTAVVLLGYGIKLYRKHKGIEIESPPLPVKPKSNENQISAKQLKVIIKNLEKVKKVESKLAVSKQSKLEEKDSPQKNFNLLKTKSKLSLDFWKTWYLEKYHPGRIVLINMELTNGFHKLFIVKEKDEGFVFRGKKYIFDDDSKYYNLDTKLYTFDFHEQIALPFKRKIPVTQIKKTLESTEGVDIEYAINPSTLQRFMTAKIAEGIMKGTQLDEFMKKLQMFLIVTMIAVLIHLALFLYGSGMLKNIKVPGLVG